MESNHFIMGQLKSLEVMKNLPQTVANQIANQIKIEQDKQKEEVLNVR